MAIVCAPHIDPALVALSIPDPTANLRGPGTTGRLNVLGTFSNGVTYEVTPSASFTSSDPSGVFIDPQTGDYAGVREGVFAFTASYRDQNFTVDLGFLPSGRIPSFLPEVTLTVGESSELTATVQDSNGDWVDVRRLVVWTSDDPNVVTVSNERDSNGLIHAINPGSVYVSPKFEGNQWPTLVTVVPPP